IDVVVDHEYAASNRRLPRRAGWGNRRRFGLIAPLGQSNDEPAAPAETGAAGLDVPAVQLDKTLDERQPDSEAALRTVAWFELPEEVEHAVEHLGGKAEPVVGDRQYHLRVLDLHGELDAAAVRGVFR